MYNRENVYNNNIVKKTSAGNIIIRQQGKLVDCIIWDCDEQSYRCGNPIAMSNLIESYTDSQQTKSYAHVIAEIK